MNKPDSLVTHNLDFLARVYAAAYTAGTWMPDTRRDLAEAAVRHFVWLTKDLVERPDE